MPTTRQNGSERALRIPVYILAGGHSRRFGTDKARAEIDGVPLIVRLAESLSCVALSLTVVAATAGHYDDLGFDTIGDVIPDKGPAGGVLTALQHAKTGWVFIVACDTMGTSAEWVEALYDARRTGAHVVVFKSDRLEPLFGLYHTSAASYFQSSVASGRFRMQSILAELSAIELPAPPHWSRATNVNRPSDI